jgi:hypothetical protein
LPTSLLGKASNDLSISEMAVAVGFIGQAIAFLGFWSRLASPRADIDDRRALTVQQT